MKKIILIAFVMLALVSCSKKDNDIKDQEIQNANQKVFVLTEPYNSVRASDILKVKDDLVYLDIRSVAMIQKDGGIISPNVVNLDYYSQTFNDDISNLDKNKKYFIYGQYGNNSKKVVEMMKKLGFENVYYLRGGVVNGWLKMGKELFPYD